MGTTPVLHRTARAIGSREFLDAVQATCPPRFPHARGSMHRHVALAISGGVDSMALAYLCSQIRRWDPWFKVSDNPLSKFLVYVVDHKLRDGSGAEARAVKKALAERLGLKADVLALDWEAHLAGRGITDPSSLPNIESLARRLRYRRLGSVCRFSNVASLFLAHHEDDQYETVLMRLLSGHGLRGLRGMRPAADIPECQDMHRVYQSGFVDDQLGANPWYNMRPSMGQRRALRRSLRDDMDPALLAREIRRGLLDSATPYLDDDNNTPNRSRSPPPLEPLDVEDGGVTVYRPLLEFSKDRLVATCLENGVPWFEDPTNADRTLTLRNAVRHLYRHHELPEALRKPAVLRLAERCNARVRAEEAEADRLFSRAVVHDFVPGAGTLLVQLPSFSLPQRTKKSARRRRRRLAHYRLVASVLVRKLLSVVTPEPQVSAVSNLQAVVPRLFPSLAEDQQDPKSFVIGGVHFIPVQAESLRWYLARAPHPSPIPRPLVDFPKLYFKQRWRSAPERWKWTAWFMWHLFDGRFWIRLRHRLPFRVHVRPFEPEFAKAFREGLANDEARDALAAMLRKYAPGKVRYTLPAIYSTGDAMALLRGSKYWVREEEQEEGDKSFISSRWDIENAQGRELQLLALPTLGVHVAGAENWLQWEVRYRKVDLDFLAREGQRPRGKWRNRVGGGTKRKKKIGA